MLHVTQWVHSVVTAERKSLGRSGAIHAEQSHFLLETIFNGRELLLLDLPIRESSDRLRVVGHIRRFPPEAIKNDLGTKQSPVTMDIAMD